MKETRHLAEKLEGIEIAYSKCPPDSQAVEELLTGSRRAGAPELTEAWTKESFGLTVEEYRTAVLEKLTRLYELEKENTVRAELIQKAVELSGEELTPSELDNGVKKALADFEAELKEQGSDLSAFLNRNKTTLSTLKRDLKKQLRPKLLAVKVLTAIAGEKELAPTDAAVEEAVQTEADAVGMPLGEYLSTAPGARDEIRVRLCMDMAVDYLYAHARVICGEREGAD